MAKPIKAQIEKEIKELTEIKPKVRHFSIFGDDNWKAVEIQIEVLSEDLSIEEIEDKWGDYSYGAPSLSLYENATEARAWLDGDSEEESLAEGWHSLIKKE
jgi:hypothetical protein